MDTNYVITIGRQFGSGGRELGRILSEKLGIPFYDKELLFEAARKAGLSEHFFVDNDERVPRFFNGATPFSFGFSPMSWYSGSSSISDDNLYRLQSDFIHEIARQGPCIIVGRSADYVLRDLPNVISVFVSADIESCVDRIIGRLESSDRSKARHLAERTNKLRANYYNFYTDKRWGDAASYDLCLDSSKMPMNEIAEIVVEYINRRLRNGSTAI